MKKTIALISFIFVSICLHAQIQTTAKSRIILNDIYGKSNYAVKSGEPATIYGYKKKGNIHFIAYSTDNFARISPFNTIPFDVDEKQLKRLPNAQSNDMKAFIDQKNAEIIAEKKRRRKQDALDGKICVILEDKYDLKKTTDAQGELFNGDTLHILGYQGDDYFHKYALYTNNAYGIFQAIGIKQLFNNLNTQNLPSINDTDVKITLKQIENEQKQREEEYKKQYREDALNGKIKGAISTLSLYDDNYKSSPFKYGETVSVVGFLEKGYKYYYALYSENGAGVYQSSSKSIFRGDIKLDFLPSTESQEVVDILAKQKIIADSLNAIKRDSLVKKLNETREQLISIYKENSPVLITDISWTSNSVGKITVNLNVTNCSLETIKYISFQGHFTNAVGDKCYNEIGGGTLWKARGIGPIGPRPTTLENYEARHNDSQASYEFDNITFYSRTADTFNMSSVTIQYMNGKTVTLSGQNLKKHLRYSNPQY